MHATFLKYLQDLKSSFWFWPAVMAGIGFALSFIMPELDQRYGDVLPEYASWLTNTRTEGARTVLSVIAGSIIGVAGVIFSITIVAVSFASGQFGPRLIGNFMRDRGSQLTMGTFIATFVYSLMILRTVRNAAADDATNSFESFVPHLSVLTALALTLASICVLIYFVHHVPETINIGNITARIGRSLYRHAGDQFPRPALLQTENASDVDWSRRDSLTRCSLLPSTSGYIQALDIKRLARIAADNKLLVDVNFRPGDFVTFAEPVLDAWHDDNWSEELEEDLLDCMAIGQARTAHQNVLFLADELVEIIGRALSPGINDPFTAVTCLNWLKVGVLRFAECASDDGAFDRQAPVRLEPVSFERFMAVIFDQSRQYIAGDRNVTVHTFKVLTEIATLVDHTSQRRIAVHHIRKLHEAAQQALPPDAREEAEQQFKEALDIIGDEGERETQRTGRRWFGGRG